MNNWTGNYRGFITLNIDPDNKGRCKIFIPGVYPSDYFDKPDLLPWAEPVMPIFGGNGQIEDTTVKFSETGWTSVPTKGSYVWVFFEGNDQNYPKYFATTQAGDGWLSEHEMQHVLSTQNFRITIDENPDNNNSSMTTNSVNNTCTTLSKSTLKTQKIRTKIEIEAIDKFALDLVIKGDVNLFIDGDMFTRITGDRHTTIDGNDYIKISKNIQKEVSGDSDEHVNGNKVIKVDKNVNETILGNEDRNIVKERTQFIGGNNQLDVGGSNIHTAGGLHDHI